MHCKISLYRAIILRALLTISDCGDDEWTPAHKKAGRFFKWNGQLARLIRLWMPPFRPINIALVGLKQGSFEGMRGW